MMCTTAHCMIIYTILSRGVNWVEAVSSNLLPAVYLWQWCNSWCFSTRSSASGFSFHLVCSDVFLWLSSVVHE